MPSGFEKCAQLFWPQIEKQLSFQRERYAHRGKDKEVSRSGVSTPSGTNTGTLRKAPQRDQGKLISALFLVKCITLLARYSMVDLSTQIMKPFGRYGHIWMAYHTLWIVCHNNINLPSRGYPVLLFCEWWSFCRARLPPSAKVVCDKCTVWSPLENLHSDTRKCFWGTNYIKT